MWIWIVLAVLVVVVGIWAVATYNGFVKLRNIVEESWKQIDVELHRRYDLIPNLVQTVKGYAAHERQTFENVTAARAAAVSPGSGPAEQAMQENMLTSALRQLLAVAPRRAEDFERCIGAATDRYVGAFNQANAGIGQRLRQAPHVGRRIDQVRPV